MGNVYFLGAGFSAAYGLPVMNQFFTTAKQNRLINQNERRFLSEVQRFAHMGVRLVTISRNNMEEILSFLEMAEQADQIPQEIKDLSKIGEKPVSSMELLRSIIARVYGPLPADLPSFERPIIELFGLTDENKTPSLTYAIEQPLRSDYQHFLSFQPHTTVITTNYDLCLETQMLRLKKPLRLRLGGNNWISAEGHDIGKNDTSSIYSPNSPATLLRLHGGVNWNSRRYNPNDKTYEFRVTSHVNPKNNLPWGIDATLYQPDSDAPILVAPTVLKHQTDGPYADQWQAAAKALKDAQRLFFIGYSFPESDAYMRYFLGASLAENVDLESITIVDPQADAIAQRLHEDKRYGAHFLDLLMPNQQCWHIPPRRKY